MTGSKRPTSILPVALALLLLCGCSSSSGRQATTWPRTLEAAGLSPESVPDPFAVTEEMVSVAREMAGTGTPFERLQHLQRALVDPARYTFDYQPGGTFTAAEAFGERKGNCVSFTNLFVALGRSLGIGVGAAFYRRAPSADVGGSTPPDGEAAPARGGSFVILRAHVVAVLVEGPRAIVFDFSALPDPSLGKLRLLTDAEVAAIYLGNRGVDALMRGDLPGAARDLDAAVRLGPALASAHGNLGVQRLRSGDRAGALAAYRRALELEPHNQGVLHNLSAFHRQEGRETEALAALAALDDRAANPYTLLVKGDLELLAGDVPRALRTYRLAQRAGPALAEPFTAIARAELSRGRVEPARKALRRALEVQPANEQASRLLDGLR